MEPNLSHIPARRLAAWCGLMLLAGISGYFALPWLLNTGPFIPRRLCGNWPVALMWVWLAANTLTAVAYYAIPFYLDRYRPVAMGLFAQGRLQELFAWFIRLCGTTHAGEVLVFWWPAYRLFALVHALTGVVSLYTAYRLRPVVRNFAAVYEASKAAAEAIQVERDIMADVPHPVRPEISRWMREHEASLANIQQLLQRSTDALESNGKEAAP